MESLNIALFSENFINNHNITMTTPHELKTIRARELICPERLDLGAKLIYIHSRATGMGIKYAREVYARHIEAFSEGTYAEPGDVNKTSLSDYLRVFDELIDSFKHDGFDEGKSLIPLNQNGVMMDGGHRVAVAAYYDLYVKTVIFPTITTNVRYDYSYFSRRKLNIRIIGYMTKELIQYDVKPVYCMVVWPKAKRKLVEKAVDIVRHNNCDIYFENDIVLSYIGLRNFMLNIYGHQKWVGTAEDGFRGLYGKVDECFTAECKIHTVFFSGNDLENTVKMKERLRRLFGIENHSLHISDNTKETIQIAELLLSPSSLHALLNGRPDKYPEIYSVFDKEAVDGYFSENAALAYYGFSIEGPLLSDKCIFTENDPTTYFCFNNKKIPSIFLVRDVLAKSDKNYRKVKALAERSFFERVNYYFSSRSATVYWKYKNNVLRVKQIAHRMLNKIGLR